jgi:hypothetical protein
VPVKPFYDALPDQSANTFQVVYSDLKLLEERSLIDQAAGLGGIEALHVMATAQAQAFVEQLQATRSNRRLRKIASRDAMVAWLYSVDATAPDYQPVREGMLDDPRYGTWLAERLSPGDLDVAAAWLHQQGLVEGVTIDEAQGPVRLYLTDPGVRCAEDFDSDCDRYIEKRQAPGSGPTVNIGTNSGPFQVAGDHARQVQHVGASAEHLRELITSVAELVRLAVPGVGDVGAQQQAALAAAADGAVDRSALQRFVNWVRSTVGAGVNAAIVPAVTSATTALMLEAGRLPGHL